MNQDRRTLLRGAGALAAAGAALSLPTLSFGKTTNPNAVKLELFAQGEILIVPDAPLPVVFPGPPPPELLQLGTLPPGAAKIVVLHQLLNDVMNFKVRLANAGVIPIFPPEGVTISDFDAAVEAATLGTDSLGGYNFAVMGHVVNVTVPSPFGELRGRAAAYSGAFNAPGTATNFSFVEALSPAVTLPG